MPFAAPDPVDGDAPAVGRGEADADLGGLPDPWQAAAHEAGGEEPEEDTTQDQEQGASRPVLLTIVIKSQYRSNVNDELIIYKLKIILY